MKHIRCLVITGNSCPIYHNSTVIENNFIIRKIEILPYNNRITRTILQEPLTFIPRIQTFPGITSLNPNKKQCNH